MNHDHYRQNNPEFFINNGKKNLVITIGDSWTWGDSLGRIHEKNQDDLQARQTQCYGKHLADELDADWINCGYCGWGNTKIVQRLYQFVVGTYAEIINKQIYTNLKGPDWPEFEKSPYPDHINNEIRVLLETEKVNYLEKISQYDNVYYFVTLTETGRQSDYYDFIEQDDYNPEKFLKLQEQAVYNFLHNLVKTNNINLTVARNFTIDYNSTNTSFGLPLNWVQLNYNYNQQTTANSTVTYNDISQCGPATGIALSALKEVYVDNITRKHNYMKYFIDQYEKTDKIRDWLAHNPLHHNIATCHPKQESHKFWANYLLENMHN